MDDNRTENELGLIWGAENIARAIGRKPGITLHMLQNDHIPGARQVCGRWVIARSKLCEVFGMAQVA
ncbi:MAG: DNA-binding protein [Mesorhizobium sp.]|nr:MAG: DNA-binding protein [Mesorhizobium sp.]